MHTHIQAGGTTVEFLVSAGLSDRQELGQSRQSDGQSDGQLATVEQSAMLAVLMEAIASRPHANSDPLANLEALEESLPSPVAAQHLSVSTTAEAENSVR
ncbi:hypothetical protein H6F88_17555 [Oculatella sp. FACHB-28]|uniref:hypothetical protein n=1 Tax=Oculatella sp. FACHB-28 TaxID=2692845 RepID=UPI00168A05DD|nr:hypothetical protein [Oculatella sp. FACHB-28]MBD2057804.1 hypothetical protein [Oculatella sp. FACHB-28]